MAQSIRKRDMRIFVSVIPKSKTEISITMKDISCANMYAKILSAVLTLGFLYFGLENTAAVTGNC
jgi:hypothetical protein